MAMTLSAKHRTQNPPPEAENSCPYGAIDGQEDDDHGQHGAKPNECSRCGHTEDRPNEQSLHGTAGCAHTCPHAGAYDYADNNGDTQLLEVGPNVGNANACKQFLNHDVRRVAMRGGPDGQDLRRFQIAPR